MIRFGADVCRNIDSALPREWLETNGIGGLTQAQSMDAIPAATTGFWSLRPSRRSADSFCSQSLKGLWR
jgi:hypothetical protein